MPWLALWPLGSSIILFLGAAAIIGVGGVMLTARAEQLAQATGLGQALVGAILLGAVTSLAGLVTSVAAAAGGHAQLAVSNAIGGIAVQTAFLAVADIFYRRANLEHAAASEENLVQAALLVALLSIPLVGAFSPNVLVWVVHPSSLLLILAYVFGMRLISGAHQVPMWHPRRTTSTHIERTSRRAWRLGARRNPWLSTLTLAGAVGLGGWIVARAGIAISTHTGIDESLVGTVFTAISTSLPELIIAVSAVRRGALTLAVGNIIGGNTFDVLFIGFSDIAYAEGSIYHAVGTGQVFWMALSILMTSVLLIGLLRRERHGIGNIGFESVLVLAIYAGGVAALFCAP